MNQNTIVSFSLPSFHENFKEAEGIVEESLKTVFDKQLKVFVSAIEETVTAS